MLLGMLLGGIFFMSSCSADSASSSETTPIKFESSAKYTYSDLELQVIKLINEHRVSIGLNSLAVVDHISFISEEHNLYMIENKDVSHGNFVERSNAIVAELGAKNVGENVAYNYNSAEAVLKAWLNSPSHKQNLEGDYTHFGIAIKIDAETGKKYYTNIFANI